MHRLAFRKSPAPCEPRSRFPRYFPMGATRIPAPKVTNLTASFDRGPTETGMGTVIWADVEVDYFWRQATPSVTIRVPVPWEEGQTSEERYACALKLARQLIDHACVASEFAPPSEEAQPAGSIAQVVENLVPASLEGISQELGLADPARTPRRQAR